MLCKINLKEDFAMDKLHTDKFMNGQGYLKFTNSFEHGTDC